MHILIHAHRSTVHNRATFTGNLGSPRRLQEKRKIRIRQQKDVSQIVTEGCLMITSSKMHKIALTRYGQWSWWLWKLRILWSLLEYLSEQAENFLKISVVKSSLGPCKANRLNALSVLQGPLPGMLCFGCDGIMSSW